MLKKRTANRSDHHLIIEIWERSIKATHHFLLEADVDFYKRIIPESLASVDLSLWIDDERVVGFSGIDEDELVMLFLDPDFIGKGYGSKIITHLINNDGIKRIDVNTQNKRAKAFYLHHGFQIESKDKHDGFGKPYPITHLIKNRS